MKALTICQPYAHLICLPETDPRHKRVENRVWPTNYRGSLAIHAGKSRSWLEIEDDGNGTEWDANYEIEIRSLDFGAVVATCTMVDCVSNTDALVSTTRPWLRTHQHVSGPWCFVLADVKRLEKPIPWRGAQGFFDIPDAALAKAKP